MIGTYNISQKRIFFFLFWLFFVLGTIGIAPVVFSVSANSFVVFALSFLVGSGLGVWSGALALALIKFWINRKEVQKERDKNLVRQMLLDCDKEDLARRV